MQLEKQLKRQKTLLILVRPALTFNVLRVSDGRDTDALNCKPTANLKEKTELSNLRKTSAYSLHAVIG
jgi:hypothetical protein